MSQNNKDYLDKVLEGRSNDEKLRVLDMTTRLGLQRDDPLWLMMIAINHVRVVTEDLPTLLNEFQTYLDQWTDANLKTLEAIASKSEIVESLATSSAELSNVLVQLVQTSNTLAQNLKSSEQTYNESVKELRLSIAGLKTQIEHWSQSNRDYQEDTRISLRSIMNTVLDRTAKSNTSDNKLLLGLALIIIGGLSWLGWSQYSQGQILQETATKMQWLLEKQNRIDCEAGRLPPESPLCG